MFGRFRAAMPQSYRFRAGRINGVDLPGHLASPFQHHACRARRKAARSMKRTQIIIDLAYLYDCLVLLGFWAAGFVDYRGAVRGFRALRDEFSSGVLGAHQQMEPEAPGSHAVSAAAALRDRGRLGSGAGRSADRVSADRDAVRHLRLQLHGAERAKCRCSPGWSRRSAW